MPPRLVMCRCDPAWPALAVCDKCEHGELESLLERQGKVAREKHPSAGAYGRLLESYDHVDRARDAADEHMAASRG